jgi:hypothetical protein
VMQREPEFPEKVFRIRDIIENLAIHAGGR